MNTIAVKLDYRDDWIYDSQGNMQLVPTFRKIKLIPILPSVSYTWIF